MAKYFHDPMNCIEKLHDPKYCPIKTNDPEVHSTPR